MHKEGDEVHVTDTEASGGSKEGVVRWVLLGGLVLAILLLSVTWIVPAMMQGDVEEEATVSGEIDSMQDNGDTTDSIVGVESRDDGTNSSTGVADDGQGEVSDRDGISVIEN